MPQAWNALSSWSSCTNHWYMLGKVLTTNSLHALSCTTCKSRPPVKAPIPVHHALALVKHDASFACSLCHCAAWQDIRIHAFVCFQLHDVLQTPPREQRLVCRSSEPPAELQLTCLAQQSYHLSGLEQGLHAFQPVVFASPDLAVCNVTVHSLALQQMEGKITYR